MEKRAYLKFIEVKKMITSLNESINLVEDNTMAKLDKALKDSVIQRFEYSIEWIWKFLKFYLLEEYGEDVEFSRQTLKSAYKAGLINNLKVFLDMIERRNRLSHDYHDEFAEFSFDIILEDYINEMNTFITFISQKYDS